MKKQPKPLDPLLEEEGARTKENPNEEESASLISHIFSSWIFPLIRKGSKKSLKFEDLYHLNGVESDVDVEEFEEIWNKQNEKSLVWSFLTIFQSGAIKLTLLRVFADCLQFAAPLLLSLLLRHLSGEHPQLWRGIEIGVLMFLFLMIRSILVNFYKYVMSMYTSRIETILVKFLYKKIFKIAPSSTSTSTGRLTNHISVDIQNLLSILTSVHHFYSTPLQLFIAVVLLWNCLGFASICGIMVMVGMIPVNYFSAKYIKLYKKKEMKAKDKRLLLTSESLDGIKTIKLNSYEVPFEKRLNELREEEIGLQMKGALLGRMVDALNLSLPFVVGSLTFSVYVLSSSSNLLTPEKAFVSLSIFNQIRQPLRVVAMFIGDLMQASVSNKRLMTYLLQEEMLPFINSPLDAGYTLQLENFRLSSRDSSSRSIYLNVKNESLTCLVGPQYIGKTRLIEAITGTQPWHGGTVAISQNHSFASQDPFIFDRSVRENIVFGERFDEARYQQVLKACQLLHDLSNFVDGDQHMCGENGCNLSTGQRVRVSLARTVYRRADLYLFDGVFAALDEDVSAKIFEEVLGPKGLLAEKSRFAITNRMDDLQYADQIMVMTDSSTEVYDSNEKFVENRAEVVKLLTKQKERNRVEQEEMAKEKHPTPTKKSRSSEPVKEGKIPLSVYKLVLDSATRSLSFLYIILLSFHYALLFSRSLWLSDWSDSQCSKRGEIRNETYSTAERLLIYNGFGIIEVLCVVTAFIALVQASRFLSRHLHALLSHSILRYPMAFYETTPSGNIMNRASRDLDRIDSRLPLNVRMLSISFCQILVVFALNSYSTRLFLILPIPLIVIYIYLLRIYLPVARQLKRLDNTKRSLVFSRFSESFKGSRVIRMFKQETSDLERLSLEIDNYMRCNYNIYAAARWINIQYDLLGYSVVLFASILSVYSTVHGGTTVGLAGLSISISLTITEYINAALRMISDFEMSIVSAERIKEYAEFPLEQICNGCTQNDFNKINRSHFGKVEWKDYSCGYRENGSLALENINLSIGETEKVAVVGRTGSGKSSLVSTLFRLHPVEKGVLKIDGVDISSICRHTLRKEIGIVPQDLHIFSGSLKWNLDPIGNNSDLLWAVIQCSGMSDVFRGLTEGYETEINQNVSAPIRQMIVRCRCLLKNARRSIVVLDEVTEKKGTFWKREILDHYKDATVFLVTHDPTDLELCDSVVTIADGKAVTVQ